MVMKKHIPLVLTSTWLAFLNIVLLMASCCGAGSCDSEKRVKVWDDYRRYAQTQRSMLDSGEITADQLEARYYILIMERDINSANCGCPLESPSNADRQQKFASQMDPGCVLVLTKRYGDILNDTTAQRVEERKGLEQMLSWYGYAVGLGNVHGYDAYGAMLPVDTALINKRVRELSASFFAANVPPKKVELIDGK